jgi:hypothetical protein
VELATQVHDEVRRAYRVAVARPEHDDAAGSCSVNQRLQRTLHERRPELWRPSPGAERRHGHNDVVVGANAPRERRRPVAVQGEATHVPLLLVGDRNRSAGCKVL